MSDTSNVTLSNSTYDKLKHFTQVVLPAIGTLYFTLSGIWGLPYGEQVVGSVAAITLFCGVTLAVSNKNYKSNAYNGEIVARISPEGTKTFSLILAGDPQDLEDQDEVKFKVVGQQQEQDRQFWDPSAE